MTEMPRFENRAFEGVIGAITRDALDLADKQFKLFRAETRENARRLFQVIILAVIGAVALAVATVFVGIALFEWLLVLVHVRAWAACLVAGMMAVLAIILLAIARQRLVGTTFIPRRTLSSLRRDREVLFGEMDDE